MMHNSRLSEAELPLNREEIIRDYKIAFSSRQASLIGRKEVLGGKAKFGIFGDGKEVAQVAMARSFQKGDWRSGYYRDQTFMFALGDYTFRQFFAQLYAHPDLEHEPASGGRQMNSHFASRFLDEKGRWLNQMNLYNSSADISPTGGQMARLLGLAYASRLYRENKTLGGLPESANFSKNGGEVAFGTIGNASTSEGLFWECVNAAGVLQVPMLLSVWDDEYGISVHNKYQTTKESVFELLRGFGHSESLKAYDLYQVCGYDYVQLFKTYQKASQVCRKTHSPAVIHVYHMTQPQGHSTSGSHERYKSPERLDLEKERDCLRMMRLWILEQGLSTDAELNDLEKESLEEVSSEQKKAWDEFQKPLAETRSYLNGVLEELQSEQADKSEITKIISELNKPGPVLQRTLVSAVRRSLYVPQLRNHQRADSLREWYEKSKSLSHEKYSAHLLSEGESSPLRVPVIDAEYQGQPEMIDGRQVIQRYFDHKLSNDPRVFIIGEDVGQLGGVNLEFDGLAEKHGAMRVTDTGIREASILGQGMGAALRGLRPLVDIQYLDYLIYALQGMSDDLATVRYRSANGQACPVVVRTKGHRLEGIWHTGSPMAMILNSVRGIHVCVPRNGVQAAGMYQTLFQGDDPGLVIEVLNGYRVKEKAPSNLGDYTIPLGVPEVLKEGTDLTLVTYGANVRIAESVLSFLDTQGISVELIDVRTLLPFDLKGIIGASVEKTNAVLFFDEDVPGGATAFMMQQVLEKQNAYEYLDAPPRTLSAKDHRSAYGSDGDYFSKPGAEDLIEVILDMMNERFPGSFPGYPG